MEEQHSLLLMHLSTDFLSPSGKERRGGEELSLEMDNGLSVSQDLLLQDGWRTSSALHLKA